MTAMGDLNAWGDTKYITNILAGSAISLTAGVGDGRRV
jgi:hypothetical protein